ncbi:hypothetical protein WR25_12326 [Diploscapter pachys]|uniref:Uncharacterized protein n=1 Tax=Diploscapter pachys TaxID=2018661 RepID=A0A2A2LB22_9BILA|nr:hypothetical protein WR25_12326 [Diploscapter pachys]
MADQSKNPDERVQELATQFGRKLSDNEKKAAKALFNTFDSVMEYYKLELSPAMSAEFSPKFEQLGDENMARIQNFVKQMTLMSKTDFEKNMQ